MRNFISLEKLRYDERVDISIMEENDITQARIAPMLLITLVENAFKHGVNKTTGASWIKVVVCSGNELNIAVRNSSQGARPSSNGVGLKNVQEQVKLLYGSAGSVHVHSTSEEFLVEIKIPAHGV